jgi:phosphoglycolate phosphatase-like HAD superfamily hydrolase
MKLNSNTIDCFVADFDGTIAKLFNNLSKPFIIKGVIDYFSDYNIPEKINLINDPFKIWIRSYNFIAKDLSDRDAKKLFEKSSSMFLELEKECAQTSEPYEKMKETYREIRDKFKISIIVSTNHEETIKIGLKNAGIEDYVDFIVGRESIQNFDQLKPNPYLLEKALKRAGMDAKNSIYIGDNEVDMISGRKACMNTIAVLRGRGLERKNSLIQAGADFVVENFYDFLNLN